MTKQVSITITAFTDEQARQKANFLSQLGTLNCESLEILSSKVASKGPEAYDKKIKSYKNLL